MKRAILVKYSVVKILGVEGVRGTNARRGGGAVVIGKFRAVQEC